MNSINKPIDKINIGNNKTKEEYIELMNEKNKIKREMEKSREHQERKKIQEKEAGFNIHINGANEERIREQRRQELLKNQNRGNSQSNYDYDIATSGGVNQGSSVQNQKVRRQWKNPNQGEGGRVDTSQEQKYTNPFDLGNVDKKFPMPITGEKSPPRLRKKWGNSNNQISGGAGKPTRAIHNLNNEDEEDYSDSFEEIQQDFEDEVEEDQKKDQDEEVSAIQDDYENNDNDENNTGAGGKNEIEQFLKTATMNDINALRQSLSNFGEMAKQLNTKKDFKKEDDDYIEEDFEEHIDSDDGQDSEEERKEQERLRLEQLRQQQLKTQQTTRGAKNRPISATYNLAAQKIQTQRTTNPDVQNTVMMSSQVQSQAILKPINQPMSASNYASIIGGGGIGATSSIIQETPKQPNDSMKKPLNTNPFKRPFSQNVPKREQNPTVQQSAQKVTDSIEKSQSKTQDAGFSKIPIASILSKIEQLDDWQKEKLMEILDNLDSLTTSQISTANQKVKEEPKASQKAVQNLDLKFLSPGKSQNVQKSQAIYTNPNKKEIILRVIKTYGNPHLCGLTEIEVFDEFAKKITLAPAQIILKNLGNGPKISLARLVDGFKLTNDEKHMWIGYLPMHPQQLEIIIQLDKNQSLGGLKIWNYNKSAIDCTKGIKEISISVNNEQMWQGILDSGKGSTTTEYASFIIFKEGLQLPREIQPKDIASEPIEEEYEEEESKDMIIGHQQQNQEVKKDQDDFKKYRSEVELKTSLNQSKNVGGATDGGPIWLSGSQQSQRNVGLGQQSSKPLVQSQMGSRPKEDQAFKTFDLLDKYQFNQQQQQNSDTASTTSGSKTQSAVGSQRPHPMRDNSKSGAQSSGIIKPNAGPSSITSNQSKSKAQFELGVGQVPPTGNKQWTQPFQAPKGNNIIWPSSQGQSLQETSDAIQKAVNKVNQVVNNQQLLNKNKPTNQVVEESLDNLDFFKATNRGRLMNFNDDDKSQKDQQKGSRKQWQASPAKGTSSNSRLQESQLSASKQNHKGAHVIVKNPFPEKDAAGIKNSSRKTQRDEGDFLDQFLNKNTTSQQQQQLKSQYQQFEQQPTQQFLNYQSVPDYKKQDSLSPKRDVSLPKVKSYDEKLVDFTQPFIIPNLPTGQKLHFNILSTWGDMNYVGLAGIEIFDIEGQPISISPDQISACPPDINILPGYGGDPRTVDKLIDDHYITNDDLHVWLTPFTAGEDHTISIEFPQKKQISMIRIWNYNKNRIHSYRGARLIECDLDGKRIFRGEIQKAPGNLNDPENCCEIILFTDNDIIMQRIDMNDWINEKVVQNDMENTQRILQDVSAFQDERPMTATKKFSTTEIQEIQRQLKQQKPTSLFDERPQTSAIITGDQEEFKPQSSLKNRFEQRHQELSKQVQQLAMGNQQSVKGKVLNVNIIESWGDLFYVGLTGIEVWDDRGNPINITNAMIDANPRDMNSIPGHGSDYRTLDKLINKQNNTMDDNNMWLIPFNKGENHTIKIDFGKQIQISAIKFYNYNKSEEDTLRGAKQVIIQLDNKYLTPKKGITLRKGPGLVHPLLDMGQVVKFPFKSGWTPEQTFPIQRQLGQLGLFQEYELMNLPIGFMYRINLYTTHGDFYYIGLNGIEFFDQVGNLIQIKTIFAEPQGVNKLQGMEGDVRVIQNLINGNNSTNEEYNMWLAPFKNTRSYSAITNAKKDQNEDDSQEYRIPNYVYVTFEQLTCISAVRLWNYSKTPSRGVNEFEIILDDKQIYRGFAKMAPEKVSYNQDFSTVVLFTTDNKIVDKFQTNINCNPSKQQNVMLFNEKKQMNKTQVSKRPNEEFVFSDMQRPTTMAKRK